MSTRSLSIALLLAGVSLAVAACSGSSAVPSAADDGSGDTTGDASAAPSAPPGSVMGTTAPPKPPQGPPASDDGDGDGEGDDDAGQPGDQDADVDAGDSTDAGAVITDAGSTADASDGSATGLGTPCILNLQCSADFPTCFNFQGKGHECTKKCKKDSDCPATSSCNSKGVCKVP